MLNKGESEASDFRNLKSNEPNIRVQNLRHPMEKIVTRGADNVRILTAAMVEKAKSGHPGGSMGGADFTTTLFLKYMVYDPDRPLWLARDRFFLDPGHMSPMLYGVLALTGRYTMDELQQFRQWGSVTPGHPELCPLRGVDNSSGPLGQGHVMAVGCAIAERYLTARFGPQMSHKTYAFISDGGIQEEISQGAGRIAGLLGLHNLIMFYDANDVQLSTRVDEVTNEDTAAKYRAWHWNVIEIDGNDPAQISAALEEAIREEKRPTLIIGHTRMAYKVVDKEGKSMEGAVSTHGQPLSAAGADVAATIKGMGGDPEDPFRLFPDVVEAFAARREELRHIAAARHEEFHRWEMENPEDAALLKSWEEEKLPNLDYEKIEYKANIASRNASALVLNMLSERMGNMIVSSADLANSDKTDGFLKHTTAMTHSDALGRFLHAGVAELTMASIMNGIVLHGAMRAACGTFFVFSDYIKPALRMSALMELPVIYAFSHDAFRVGEDGPTHEPIEQEGQLRLLEMMDNLSGRQSVLTLRPADSAETVACWKMALENTKSPTVLIFSRQNLDDVPALSGDRRQEAWGVERGGYLVVDVEGEREATLVGSGSEVSLLVKVAQELNAEGHRLAVASIPSEGLFLRQDKEYQEKILPSGGARFGLTAGVPMTLYPLMKGAGRWDVVGLARFGASAPYKVLEEKFGFTVPAVRAKIEEFLKA